MIKTKKNRTKYLNTDNSEIDKYISKIKNIPDFNAEKIKKNVVRISYKGRPLEPFVDLGVSLSRQHGKDVLTTDLAKLECVIATCEEEETKGKPKLNPCYYHTHYSANLQFYKNGKAAVEILLMDPGRKISEDLTPLYMNTMCSVINQDPDKFLSPKDDGLIQLSVGGPFFFEFLVHETTYGETLQKIDEVLKDLDRRVMKQLKKKKKLS